MKKGTSINRKYIIWSTWTIFLCLIIGSYTYTNFSKASESLENQNNIPQKSVETRFIIELNEKAAVDLVEDISNINELKRQEKIVFNSQKNIIRDIEQITGNIVENRTALLLNTIVIYATKEEIYEIKELKQVKEVQESIIYESNDNVEKIDYTLNSYADVLKLREYTMGLTNVREDISRGYKGEGTVVAIIDSGVNYKHRDMLLDTQVITKYSEEEWKNRIDLLGYGKYLSRKVPFGYNYVDHNTEVLDSNNTHGYHVAGIVSSNNHLQGVAPNSQIVALKFMGDNGEGTTDYLVKAIEDAVILGVDVINLSIGSPYGIVSEESFQEKAISKAMEHGILCTVAAGNIATSDGIYEFSNKLKLMDTATINSPAVAKDCLAVASTNIFMYRKQVANEISKFSSWGPTNELTIKPEITAPGENILSTLDNNASYATQSGTSMATPYISGIATLVLNEIKSKEIHSFFNKDKLLEGKELSSYIKNTLMNTATPIIENEYHNKNYNLPYSVRLQGAGLANAYAAVKNRVIATYNHEAKIELGEVDRHTNFEITLTNYSDKEVRYSLEKSELYKPLNTPEGKYYIDKTEYASINVIDSVVVPANGQTKITCSLDISKEYDINCFIEGYIRLLTDNEDTPSLSIPLLAFYGDWDNEPIIDKSIYDEDISYLEEKNIFNMFSRKKMKSSTCILSKKKEYVDNNLEINEKILGLSLLEDKQYVADNVAFSPNNDENMDHIYVGLTQLRNAYEVKISVLNVNREVIREIGTVKNLTRSTYLSLGKSPYTRLEYNIEDNRSMAWDGKVINSETNQYVKVDDGQYYILLEAKLAKNSDIQKIIMPVKIDTKSPVIESSTMDKNGRYTFRVSDNIAMDNTIYLFDKGNVYEHDYSKLDIDKNGDRYIETGVDTSSEAYVIFYDVAGNEVSDKIH